ncbi:hypothetical protein EXN66_Car020680 [Channa argus]|uniref:Uncharacterized protein n=1 Tax=Channa argus TaxID=215402 RepID=A0A6G1QRN6_CHAAH|nr:hypothetical protein EXN66_Car020680 [Channa argus]
MHKAPVLSATDAVKRKSFVLHAIKQPAETLRPLKEYAKVFSTNTSPSPLPQWMLGLWQNKMHARTERENFCLQILIDVSIHIASEANLDNLSKVRLQESDKSAPNCRNLAGIKHKPTSVFRPFVLNADMNYVHNPNRFKLYLSTGTNYWDAVKQRGNFVLDTGGYSADRLNECVTVCSAIPCLEALLLTTYQTVALSVKPAPPVSM